MYLEELGNMVKLNSAMVRPDWRKDKIASNVGDDSFQKVNYS